MFDLERGVVRKQCRGRDDDRRGLRGAALRAQGDGKAEIAVRPLQSRSASAGVPRCWASTASRRRCLSTTSDIVLTSNHRLRA
jgi:hypothetical protein